MHNQNEDYYYLVYSFVLSSTADESTIPILNKRFLFRVTDIMFHLIPWDLYKDTQSSYVADFERNNENIVPLSCLSRMVP